MVCVSAFWGRGDRSVGPASAIRGDRIGFRCHGLGCFAARLGGRIYRRRGKRNTAGGVFAADVARGILRHDRNRPAYDESAAGFAGHGGWEWVSPGWNDSVEHWGREIEICRRRRGNGG